MQKSSAVNLQLAELYERGKDLDPKNKKTTMEWAIEVGRIVEAGYTSEQLEAFRSKMTHREKLEYLGSELLLGQYD